MLQVEFADGMHPVLDELGGVGADGGLDAAAVGMPDDEDVAHLQAGDGEFDGRRTAQVGRLHLVGDVAMHEDFAGGESDEFVRGHAGVRAADPEEFRLMDVFQALEEEGVARTHGLGPGAVVGDQGVDFRGTEHGGSFLQGAAHRQWA